jgi:uncharacterized protein YbaR (Trm112 family)
MDLKIWTCPKCKTVLGVDARALEAGKLECRTCKTVFRLEQPQATKEAVR